MGLPTWVQVCQPAQGSPRRLGATHALSLDVRLGPPGLGSLRVRGASPSMAPLASTARSRAWAAPSGAPTARGLTAGRL